MTGTRCPACDFLNHPDATAADAPDAPVQCNACTRVYYPAAVADDEGGQAVRLLESSRIVWSRDWDAVAVGFACGVMSDLMGTWIAEWLR